ncbi:hypothetical protein NN3_10510 [Nocardia neocaledoniensis NBRC 108232]|nr:hypothetical protein NN3_10510 [Nocardia neocaledoniensis NBRC 108232]
MAVECVVVLLILVVIHPGSFIEFGAGVLRCAGGERHANFRGVGDFDERLDQVIDDRAVKPIGRLAVLSYEMCCAIRICAHLASEIAQASDFAGHGKQSLAHFSPLSVAPNLSVCI